MNENLLSTAVRRRSLFFALAVLLLAGGCRTQRSGFSNVPGDGDVWRAYAYSIYDSAVFDSSNVRALFMLPPTDSVQVTYWGTRATVKRYYPLGGTIAGIDVWVTVVPQVQDLCRTYPADPAQLRLRIQQLLGLQPQPRRNNDDERLFVVMNVDRNDIFRPCANPDPAQPRCGAFFPNDVDTTYRAWFADQVTSRYQTSPAGYPWTRLGYTYDWKQDSPRFGASEYIIRKGSRVQVVDTVATPAYCHPN